MGGLQYMYIATGLNYLINQISAKRGLGNAKMVVRPRATLFANFRLIRCLPVSLVDQAIRASDFVLQFAIVERRSRGEEAELCRQRLCTPPCRTTFVPQVLPSGLEHLIMALLVGQVACFLLHAA
jgi:hypothetical protein